MKKKQTLALLLAGAMLVPNAFAASPEDFHDFPTDWSAAGLRSAVQNGLLNGSNGQINSSGLLVRAQMAAIVNRAFAARKTADLSVYSDANTSAWYYNDLELAVAMRTFQGANGKLNPETPITREEAFVVLARAFALESGDTSVLNNYTDGASVSAWAQSSVAALIENGYVADRPAAGITIVDLTDSNKAMQYGVSLTGVYIQYVTGSNAKKAGLQKGDLVYYINDVKVTDSAVLLKEIQKHKIGSTCRDKGWLNRCWAPSLSPPALARQKTLFIISTYRQRSSWRKPQLSKQILIWYALFVFRPDFARSEIAPMGPLGPVPPAGPPAPRIPPPAAPRTGRARGLRW